MWRGALKGTWTMRRIATVVQGAMVTGGGRWILGTAVLAMGAIGLVMGAIGLVVAIRLVEVVELWGTTVITAPPQPVPVGVQGVMVMVGRRHNPAVIVGVV